MPRSISSSGWWLGKPLNFFRFHDASVRSRATSEAVNVAECLRVIRWILGQVTPRDAMRTKLCKTYAFYWVPALISMRVPPDLKRPILRDVKVIDPHVLRRVVYPAWVTIRLKFLRYWRTVGSTVTAPRT
jgi:hypothetical protein